MKKFEITFETVIKQTRSIHIKAHSKQEIFDRLEHDNDFGVDIIWSSKVIKNTYPEVNSDVSIVKIKNNGKQPGKIQLDNINITDYYINI